MCFDTAEAPSDYLTKMATYQTLIRFNDAQVDDLRRLGVLPGQITLLDSIVDAVSPLVAEVAPMQDLRDKLASIETAVRDAHSQISGLLQAKPAMLASTEVRDRIRRASTDAGGDGNELQDVLAPLHKSLQTVTAALRDLPKGQRRGSGAASMSPVRLIHTMLVKGWNDAHPVHLYRHANLGRHLPVRPKYPFPPSKAEGSPFRGIAEICYGAMRGTYVGNPETAIKAYMKWAKEEGAKERALKQG